MKATALFATKIGEPDYCEQLITENPEAIEKATAWAKEQGFDRFRTVVIDLSTPPEFGKNVLNI